jgi:chromosome partitioning protein
MDDERISGEETTGVSAFLSGFGPDEARPYTIVLGNTKGGTGKSTLAMHLTSALLKLGYRVGTIDLDGAQGTLSRYVANRLAYVQETRAKLRVPEHVRVYPSELENAEQAAAEERRRVRAAYQDLRGVEFIVIDTPGSDNLLARLGHACADTLITPVNDSLIDLDVLAQVDRQSRSVLGPSVYTRMVWELNNSRVTQQQSPIDWIVLRNRMAHITARNMLDITRLMDKLATRIGFRLAPGMGERVVYRELFMNGLTVLDIDLKPGEQSAGSRLSARQEVVDLINAVGIQMEFLAAE